MDSQSWEIEVNSNSAEGKLFRNAKAYEQELAHQERQTWGSRGVDPKRTRGGLDRLSLVLFAS